MEYFARPSLSAQEHAAYLAQFGDRSPAPHEPRPEPPTQRMQTTRWRATVTTFGPWVKIPVTLYLVVRPIVALLRSIANGTFSTGPFGALQLVSYALFIGVGLWIAYTVWRPGKVDTRPGRIRRRA